ncbi:hypothetical protein RD055328_06850 [Companilactobacillus sp. RD055328]|uniref:Ig-like domain-containing protein n=1 Tax=Companilactobacillus sp. RD055328 TaxID=2916634 RepID=UPI001FC84CAD|nr:Ig-like domain-containing protein [Companilactobacillus sp. RD055328]GKQ42762.1 hypothetical protein RD055328_06850 [Companilactobacillus sp. RD055328]
MKKSRLVNSLLVSSMVLGLMVNTSASVVNAETTNDQKTENVKPAGIEFQTEGTLSLSGSAMDGLELVSNNTVTRGNLHLQYDVKSYASINWNDKTEAIFKLPEELNEIAASGKLIDYIESPHFSYNSTIGGNVEHDYTKGEMSVSKDPYSNAYLLKLQNPRISGVGINTKLTVSMNLDLGALVTDTGMRIPHAINRENYQFATTLAAVGEIIDWELVGNTNGSDLIPVEVLDPGYDLLQNVPTIKEPVYNTSTKISGVAYPKSAITVRDAADGKVIGKGVTDDSGIYEVAIPRQAVGTILSVTENTGVGESKPTTTIVQQDPNQLLPPTVDTGNTISESARSLKGKGSEIFDVITLTNLSTGETMITQVLPGNIWFINNIPASWFFVGNMFSVTEYNGTQDETSDPYYITVVADEK